MKKMFSEKADRKIRDKSDLLSCRVDELNFSVRVTNCLRDYRIVYIRDLVCKSEADLLRKKNFGQTSLLEINSKLKKLGLSLGMNISCLKSTGIPKDNGDSPTNKRKERPLNLWPNLKERSNSLEEELSNFINIPQHSYNADLIERNNKIIASYFGLDGGGRKALQSVGKKFDLTRERVRQICDKFEKDLMWRVQRQTPHLPIFNASLKFIAKNLPDKASVIEAKLSQNSISKRAFRLEGLLCVAQFLGRVKPFYFENFRKQRFVVKTARKKLASSTLIQSRKCVSSMGIANIYEIIAQIKSQTKQLINKNFIVSVLDLSENFNWIDESSGWFWLPSVPQNRLINIVKKILSVSNNIDISELRSGITRHHHLKGFALPRHVLLEFCRQSQLCQVENTRIIADPPLDWDKVLSGTAEWVMAKALKENGPVMEINEFEKKCIGLGVNEYTFNQHISYSPILEKYSSGVYGLRGHRLRTGKIEPIKLKKTRSKVLVDFGWTSDKNIWISHKLSLSIIKTGVLNIPEAMKPFLQGNYSLTAADGTKIGNLKIQNRAAWNLRSFFRRRGGDIGDFSVLEFDLTSRDVKAYIGDMELLDKFRL